MSKKEIFDITCILKAETERAILVHNGLKQAWLPKSQIEYEKQPDGTYVVTAPVWLLHDKELI